MRYLIFVTVLFIFSGCQPQVKPDNTRESVARSYAANVDMGKLFDVTDSSEKNSDELFFHDSKGRVFPTINSSYGEDAMKVVLTEMTDQLLRESRTRLPRSKRFSNLNVTLELDVATDQKEHILGILEEHLAAKRDITLHAQSGATQAIVSKIIAKELDPFYVNDGEVSQAEASDIIIYVKAVKEDNRMLLRGSILNKASEVLSAKSSQLFFNKDEANKLRWVTIEVPHADGRNFTKVSVMSRPVSEQEFLGHGSLLKPMTNVSIEAANNFCSTKFNGALLVKPYYFEYARRSGLLQKPNSPATIEMISPADYENDDELYFVEGDHLESTDMDVSTMIIFRWNSQQYYSISSSYKSHEMTFRCYR